MQRYSLLFALSFVCSGAFAADYTTSSGQALYGKGGAIVGSSLEGSNTDIADEFTKLIVTQQAYSANTKVITTSNSMVQDLLNVSALGITVSRNSRITVRIWSSATTSRSSSFAV